MRSERGNYLGAYFSWLMDSYDLGAVVITASVLGRIFFPTLGQLGAVLPIVFTVVSRPLGGLLFGYVADIRGRKLALLLTVIGYSASIGLTALLPTYYQVGLVSAIALSVLRLVQGVFIGGDVSSSFTIAMESVRRRRGFLSSIVQSGTLVGFVLVDFSFIRLSSNLPWFLDCGWRLLFLLGMIPAVLAVFIRSYAVEPKVYLERERLPPLKGLSPIYQTLLVMVGFWLAIYAGPQYLPVFFGDVIGLRPVVYGHLVLLANLIGIPAMLLSGFASDYVGRRTTGAVGTAAAALGALMFYVAVKGSPAAVIPLGFLVNLPLAITPAYLSERFRTFSRATGVGFSYNGAFIVAGFSQLMIAGLSKAVGPFVAPAVVFSAGSILAAAGLLMGPETLRGGELKVE
jgi:MFS family permease